MTLKLNGSSSGSVALDAPASTTGGADVALTLPVDDGDSGEVLQTNGSGALSWAMPITHIAPVTLGSVTDKELSSSLPAGWKRLTVIFKNVSQTSNGFFSVQLGKADGTYYTSGYAGSHGYIAGTSPEEYGDTAGFGIYSIAGSDLSGSYTIVPFQATGTSDTYISQMQATNGSTSLRVGSGILTGVNAAITRVRLHCYESQSFDAGSASLMYEM
tara:strand:+ start:217 stop:861 length:645 start_codon:yes stop_codon:yes gene_type:complete